ncbi:MAG: hypothetical protein HYZ53_05065 [Planctomycetes bacterium]|nr:hypothetical protein [Planctomycetota bacterium]
MGVPTASERGDEGLPETLESYRRLGGWGLWKSLALHRARDAGSEAQCLLGFATLPGAVAMNAEVLQSLEHPNLVRVLRVLEWEDRPVAVFEWPGGETLRRKLVREVRLGVGPALSLLAGAAGGLLAAQSRGLWHGALDLDSILFCDGGDVRVLGTGIQFRSAEAPVPEEVPYAAPYYHASKRAGDWRDDVLALGVITFAAMTGRPPVAGSDLAKAASHLRRGRWPLSGIGGGEPPPRLVRLFDRIAHVHKGAGIRSLTDLLVELDAARKEAISLGLLSEESTLTEQDRIQLRIEVLAKPEAQPRPRLRQRLARAVEDLREGVDWQRLGLAGGPATAALVCLALLWPIFHADPSAHVARAQSSLPRAEVVASKAHVAEEDGQNPPAAEAALARAQAFLRSFPEDRAGATELLEALLKYPGSRAARWAERELELVRAATAGAAAAAGGGPATSGDADLERVGHAASVFVQWEEFASARALWSECKSSAVDAKAVQRADAELASIDGRWRAWAKDLLEQAKTLLAAGNRSGALPVVNRVHAQPPSPTEQAEAAALLRECAAGPDAARK